MADNKNTFVNVSFENHLDLLQYLEERVAANPETTRSAYIRSLVRKDKRIRERRALQQNPTPTNNRKPIAI